jgi:saccharopine dehydrogenase (NAD+, L-glutamate forming)
MSRQGEAKKALAKRRAKEGRPEGRKARWVQGKPGRDSVLGYYLLPMPTIDPLMVTRSAAALDAYGPDFTYSHFAGLKTLRYAVGGSLAVGSMVVAANIPPLRNALKKRIKQGEGPSKSRRDKSWFTVDFVGEAAGTSVHTRVSGGDPGYTETSKMLAESALSLAFDDNPPSAGQVTTAVAMGDNLLARLRLAGITFEVL